MATTNLPQHLKRYIVEQDYSRYTAMDQGVWRYIMRQLRDFLGQHAHPCYLEGLEKTGIEIDRIPDIRHISDKIQKFGWQAVPVSGFIPPAAFMELQAHGFLPIASDMRTLDHVAYTPAPDIVHEAAGHAPILVEPEYAAYLKSYAQIASRAIISHEDMAQYEAIRQLSDMKEDPSSTAAQIAACERELGQVTASVSHISEAALLGRMNWWTAEYGLIGSLDQPRLFGAGLLSSISEARECLNPRVRKIPLSLDCIHVSYDITEPQPQLFVASNFGHLIDVLEELANQMAFRIGGIEGLEKAKQARTVNTVELDSGLQISGLLKDFIRAGDDVAYLQFDGPSQLSLAGRELDGHGKSAHPHGFGAPVGPLLNRTNDLSRLTEAELRDFNLAVGLKTHLQFASGVDLQGEVTRLHRDPKTSRLILISFKNCRVVRNGAVLFDPAWGTYDMAVGLKVVSVFGGPADRAAYGETSDFAAKMLPRKQWPAQMQRQHQLYADLRAVREALARGSAPDLDLSARLATIEESASRDFPQDWLLRLDLLELSAKFPHDVSRPWHTKAESELTILAQQAGAASAIPALVRDGLRLI